MTTDLIAGGWSIDSDVGHHPIYFVYRMFFMDGGPTNRTLVEVRDMNNHESDVVVCIGETMVVCLHSGGSEGSDRDDSNHTASMVNLNKKSITDALVWMMDPSEEGSGTSSNIKD